MLRGLPYWDLPRARSRGKVNGKGPCWRAGGRAYVGFIMPMQRQTDDEICTSNRAGPSVRPKRTDALVMGDLLERPRC